MIYTILFCAIVTAFICLIVERTNQFRHAHQQKMEKWKKFCNDDNLNWE